MTDIAKMFETLNTAVLASDVDFKVIYANKKCKEMFKVFFDIENLVGSHLADCHKPETMEIIKGYYQEYRKRTRNLDYYTTDLPDGKLTVVNVPFYNGSDFAGVVEFIFEDSLA